jgi:hypothetical protein
MQRVVKLLAILFLLLLPVRIAQAHGAGSPDAMIAALDLGHCSGATADKQHGRIHAHCSIVGDAASDMAALGDPFLVTAARPASFAAVGSMGPGPQAATPPPRIRR